MYISNHIVYNILINQLTDSSVADETFDITFFFVIEYIVVMYLLNVSSKKLIVTDT